MLHATFRSRHFTFDRPLCRLGLATRGTNRLTPADIRLALDRGVNFLNWCGNPDGLSEAIAGLGPRRREVMVCAQFEARAAAEAATELAAILRELGTDYVDVLTFYYVEEPAEWRQIIGPGGALEYCRKAQREGRVRVLGLTSHQRPLAADMARSGLLDLLMIRYNAAHRGAETDVFPTTDALGLPVVVYTCLRCPRPGAHARAGRHGRQGATRARARPQVHSRRDRGRRSKGRPHRAREGQGP
jgi:aryl-alcohol dehydrogenase-like predicted oxidoreductase